METPTFPRFAAAPKCDPAQLVQPHELLLDRPVRRRWAIPEPTREALLFAFVLAVTVYAGWKSYQIGTDLRQIDGKVGELLAAQAQAELDRIVGNEESLELMDTDRASEAVVRAIERTMERRSSEGSE